ncbi:MAG: ribonuclease P protein component [Bacillota bacterium]
MESLKKNSHFQRVYKNGSSKASKYLVVYWLDNRNNNSLNRYGITISKKIGNAVVRNKLKRRIKEILRKWDDNNYIKSGLDIVIIARKPVIDLDYHQIKKDLKKLFYKCSLIDS